MDKLDEIKRLRKEGLTIRAIAQITGIPRSTVHKLLRGQSPPMDKVPDEAVKYYFELIHMPYTYRCPHCGREQNHVWLCLKCLKFIPADCEDDKCVEGFDLSEIIRGQQ